MVGARVVVFSVVPSVRVVGVLGWRSSPGFLFNAKLSHFLPRGSPGRVLGESERDFGTGSAFLGHDF